MLENLFVSISRYFGYALDERRWHADVLNKMTLHVSDGRVRVLADNTFRQLDELLRFRHFKRHRVGMGYDWVKLDDLCSVFRRVVPLVKRDLSAFRILLERIPPQDSA